MNFVIALLMCVVLLQIHQTDAGATPPVTTKATTSATQTQTTTKNGVVGTKFNTASTLFIGVTIVIAVFTKY